MDFLLCCPRGPDHQGRHAVQRKNQQQTAPPWAAGAEKDKEEEKTGHAAAPAARSNLSGREMRPETEGSDTDARVLATQRRALARVAGHRSSKEWESSQSGSAPCAAQYSSRWI